MLDSLERASQALLSLRGLDVWPREPAMRPRAYFSKLKLKGGVATLRIGPTSWNLVESQDLSSPRT